ncbi:MAG: hypothetical protein V2A57_04605 [Elusimicrobiota bacterium]|nr:hypothetical protein [Elusimicrobiota bacterium]
MKFTGIIMNSFNDEIISRHCADGTPENTVNRLNLVYKAVEYYLDAFDEAEKKGQNIKRWALL